MSADKGQADLHLKAPAKINLILRVLGRREDGYHELETWMQKISLCDYLDVKILASPIIELSSASKEVPADRRNLVWRAAELFFEKSSEARGQGAAIHLQKNIPVSAGLGGGSSDAGTLLHGLNTYFGNEFSIEDLISMAKSLGADVPFFVYNAESVLATGIGEKMLPVTPLQNCTYLLVNPGVSVSTAAIFEKYALTRANKNSTLTGFRMLRPEDLTISALENDLEKVTLKLFPVISEIKEELRSSGADTVLMSGSGPTVFGIFTDNSGYSKEYIENVVDRLRHKYGEKVYIAE